MRRARTELAKVHWVIAGGESGAGSRPMHPDWVRAIRAQCSWNDTPFLFKQWGEWAPELAVDPMQRGRVARLGGDGRFIESNELSSFTWPEDSVAMTKVGKKKAGRDLDGDTHDGFPAMVVPV